MNRPLSAIEGGPSDLGTKNLQKNTRKTILKLPKSFVFHS